MSSSLRWLAPALLSLCPVSASFGNPTASIPFVFEKNVGQADLQVRYFARAGRATVWLVDSGPVLSVDQNNRRAVLRMNFAGARPHPVIDGAQPLAGRSNYFIGRDPSNWHRDVSQFGAVRYRGVYPGIDVLFRAAGRVIEYDWIVAPGADPGRIRMSFEGSQNIRIERTGDVVLRIGDVEIVHKHPTMFQETAAGRREIRGRFIRRGHFIGFELAQYDRSRPLTIDPILTYATHLGGSGNMLNQKGDYATGVASDAHGNPIVVGSAASTNFPTKSGLYDAAFKTVISAFITKLNPAGVGGNSILWSTYFGGNSSTTQGGAVATDAQGNVFITGGTAATDFPIRNGFQTSISPSPSCNTSEGNQVVCLHAFTAKISADGTQLLYSSYLGGSSYEFGTGIAVDSAGKAWVTGFSQSVDFPLKGNYVQGLKGIQAGFVCQISADGSQLLYSTLMGGEKVGTLEAIAVDSAGNAYVAGYTNSVSFPVASPYQATLPNPVVAGVVAKINPAVRPSLIYSTYLGGTDAGSRLFAVAVDGKGNIFVGGRSAATTFPVTANAIQSGSSVEVTSGGTSAVVAELNPSSQGAAQLQYSTFLSGGIFDEVRGIAVDKSGRIIVGGDTQSFLFPTTADAFQADYFGTFVAGQFSDKAFLSVIDPTVAGMKGLVYSTYYGGSSDEAGAALALDPTGAIATVVGNATSNDLFVTPGAYQKGLNSQYGDVFVATFNLAQTGPTLGGVLNAASFSKNTTAFAPGEIVTFFGTNIGPASLAGAQVDNTGHLATTLAGCQLFVDGFAAPFIYALDTQVSVVLPYEITPEIGQNKENYAQMVCNGIAGNVLPFLAGAADPGIFTSNASGVGQAAALNQDLTLNSASNPAAQGSEVVLYATGEGVLTPTGQDGRLESGPLSSIPVPTQSVAVTFGTTPSPKIYYAGVAPGEVDGLLQINAQVPSGLTPGNVPVTITIGKNTSPSGVTIAVK